MSTGFLYKPKDPLDFVAGAETGVVPVVNNPKKNWEEYLSIEEKQKGKFGDSMACVTFSALNSIEAQFELLRDKLPKDVLKTLKDMGYTDSNGQLNLSDRFTAKMSGTTKEGNYLTSVWDSIRNHGALPEKDWPFVLDELDWNEYYKPIPKELKDKALYFKKIFDVKYEWLDLVNFKEHLKTAPIQIAVKVDGSWSTSAVVPPTSSGFGHAVLLYSAGKHLHIYDHYFKFKKVLDGTYPLICALRGVLSIKTTPEPTKKKLYYFTTDLHYKSPLNVQKDVVDLQDCLKKLGFMSKAVTSTGYYGDITAKAVYDFQIKYKVSDIVELERIQGRVVGPRTRAKLNEIC